MVDANSLCQELGLHLNNIFTGITFQDHAQCEAVVPDVEGTGHGSLLAQPQQLLLVMTPLPPYQQM